MYISIVLLLSAALQLIAAWLALRQARLRGPLRAWLLIAGAILLMAVRRIITLAAMLSGTAAGSGDAVAETVALVISVLMVTGVAWLAPLLRAAEEARQKGAELEVQVASQAAQLTETSASLQAEIDGREQVEAAARLSEAHYRALFENAHDAILVADENAHYIDANPQAERMTGYSRAELLGMSLVDLTAPGVPGQGKPMYAEFVREGRMTGEYKLLRKDGSEIEVEFAAAQVAPGVFMSTLRDITERKRAEAALAASEARARTLLDAPPDAIVLLDAEGTVLAANYTAVDRFGLAPGALVGQRIYDLFSPDVAARRRARVEEAFRTGQTVRFEDERAGLWLDNVIRPIYGGMGQLTHVAVYARDITARKRAEDRLARLNACFLAFGPDPDRNIEQLVELCGDLMGATCALYNRLDRGLLTTLAQWQAPPGYDPVDEPQGHICYDVIRLGGDQTFVVHDLQNSPYAETDPNVRPYHLETYIGQPVRRGDQPVGSLCVVYQEHYEPDAEDRKLMGIIAAALSVEEERKRMQDALRQSETRYRTVVEDQIDQICRYLPDGTLTFVNSAYCRALGRPRRELIGRNFMTWVSAGERARIQAALESLTPDRPVCVTEHYTRSDDGEKWELWTRRAIFDAEGQVIEYQAVGRDVTEAKQAERALRESEARMQLVVQSLPVMVAALDENDRYIMWNRECERVTGYYATEIIGNPDACELLYPDDEARAQLDAMTDESPRAFRDLELPLVCKDGARRVVSWSSVAEQHPIPGWATWSVGLDITERLKSEEALLQAHERLEQRVVERTQELRAANEQLQREIAERERAEAAEREQRLLAEALRDTSAMLNSALDLDEVLRRLLANIERVVPHDAADIMFLEGSTARMAYCRGYAALGVDEEALCQVTFETVASPHMQAMIRTGSAQVIPDVTMYEGWVTIEETAWIRSHLCAPLLLAGEVIGFINVNSATPGAFTEADAERLQAFAVQAATATRNARLYQQARQEIAERQRAQAELLAQRTFLRQIIDAAPSLVYVKDRAGRYTLVNQKFAEVFGAPVDELEGKTDAELVSPVRAARYRRQDLTVIEKHETLFFPKGPMQNLTTGEWAWYQTTKVPLRAPDGTVEHVLGVAADISEGVAREEALRESEAKFRAVIEQSGDGITLMDAQGTFIEWNRGMERITGLKRADVVGRPAWEVQYEMGLEEQKTPEAYAALKAMFDDFLAAGEAAWLDQPMTREIRRADGERRVVQAVTFRVEREGDLLIGSVVRDITGLKQAEEELRASRERFRIISELASDIAYCFRVDPDGSIHREWVIGAFEAITGFTSEESAACGGWTAMVHPDDLERMESLLADMVSLGVEPELTYRSITKSGDVRYLRTRHRIVWDESRERVVRFYATAQDVTERRRIEQALRESEEQFRTLAEVSPALIAIARLAPDGETFEILYVNPAIQQITGYSQEELQAMVSGAPDAPDHVLPDDSQPEFERRLVEALSNANGSERHEARMVARDGRERWVDYAVAPIDYQGTPAVMIIALDITERKQAEQQRQAERQFLRHIIDALPNLIFVKDPAGRFVLANQAMARWLGTTVDRMVGKTDAQLRTDKERAARYRQQDQIVIASRRTLFLEQEEFTDPDTGQPRWFQATKVPLVVPGSAETHVLGVATDISARKAAENQLRQSQAATAAIIAAIPDLIFRLDRQGRVLDIYADDETLLDVPRDEALGRALAEVLPPDVVDLVMAALGAAFETGQVQLCEYELDVPAGRRLFEARLIASSPDEGLAIVRDNTDRQEAQRRTMLYLMEKERSRILAEFIKDASQEFGTPLSVIKTSLYLLDRSDDVERRARSMKMLHKQTSHIEKLVDGLLTMARLDSGEAFTFNRADLNQVAYAVMDRMAQEAEEAGITLTLEPTPDLPPIQADPRLLQRALANLVDNAILYNQPGGAVVLRTRREDEQVVFEVHDTGIGIDEEHLEPIFHRFFRVDPAREKRGAGLGLAIAHKIIERHGGSITVESTPGTGSIFRVFLPVDGG